MQSALRTASCASGPRVGRSLRAASEEAGTHPPQQAGEPTRCSASEEADGPHHHASHSPKAGSLAPDAVIMKSFRGNSNLLKERPPSVNPGGLGDGLPLRRAQMICRAGVTSLPLNSEEFCNSAGTNPDAGLPFHRRTPEGSLALPGPESRYGSRSTRRVPKNPLCPACRGRASALSSRLRPRHWRRNAGNLDENRRRRCRAPKSRCSDKTPSLPLGPPHRRNL